VLYYPDPWWDDHILWRNTIPQMINMSMKRLMPKAEKVEDFVEVAMTCLS
jgi:hypothetical protein